MAEKSAGRKGGGIAPLSSLADNVPKLILRLVVLMLLDAIAIWFLYRFIFDGSYGLAVTIAIVVIVINVVFLRGGSAPLRWIVPGLAFMAIYQIYPVFFTVYTAFTNYGDGHLIEKPVAIRQIEGTTYLPEDQAAYTWKAYTNPDGSYALWLTSPDAPSQFATSTGESFTPEALAEQGATFDDQGVPTSVGAYTPLPRNQLLTSLGALQNLEFGDPEQSIRIVSPSAAAAEKQLYVYDEAQDLIISQKDGTIFANVQGTYTSESGEQLIPGFPVWVGAKNFIRVLTGPAIRGPLATIFSWTFVFAFLTVLTTFVLGLLMSLVLNDPSVPFRRGIRVLMIVPYALPAFIGVLIWRGMFNPILGIIGSNWDPGWFSSPYWAKVGIIIVNLWLGYAYMFLITTGALQGIPSDIYEAAKVDGASGLRQFRRITLPLLLVAVGPLLIGSFAFNFNNFTVIDLYNQGGPPIPGTPTPAGYTDILISYSYRLAFGGGRGADYGLAAAISIIIFIIVGAITLFNFRYTGMLEEVSENV